jgi:hypothetical protein
VQQQRAAAAAAIAVADEPSPHQVGGSGSQNDSASKQLMV